MTTTLINRASIIALSCIPLAGALLNGFYNGPLYRFSPALFWLVDIFFNVLAPAVVLLVLAKFAGIMPKHFGLADLHGGVLKTVVTSVFFALLLFLVYKLAENIGWRFTYRWYREPDFNYGLATPNGLLRPLVVMYWAFTAGFVESIFYIGLPWMLWRNYFGFRERRGLFICLSAVVFAAAHWEQGPHLSIAAFTYGGLACLLYLKTNDLWPLVGAHTLIDIGLFA